MSSEIRAGNERTYWILSNGAGYIDGVTDPGLVTTVGNGWHIYWIGSDHAEYVAACVAVGIVPRNSDSNTPTVSELPIEIDPLFLIQNLSDKIKELEEQKTKIEEIDKIAGSVQELNTSQQQVVSDINVVTNDLAAQQQKIIEISPVIAGERISATQARLWLIQNGFSLDSIYSIINTIEDQITRESVLAQWEYAPYIERSHPWIVPLIGALGIQESDLDRVFQEASNL